MTYLNTIEQFSKTLGNLENILDKVSGYADAKKFDPAVVLNARLAPDQFHFIRQVQIACDTAKLCAARLAGKDAPVHEDKEATLAELKSRIASVRAYLATFTEKDFAGAGERRISQPRWEGKSLSGIEYLTQHATPNLYFHVTTAYAILRHNGLDVGKKDYLGPLPLRA